MSDEMDEIWVLYADDGAQAMDATEAALLALEDAPAEAQPGHVAALFRAVHTFKGNARVLGLGVVESRAHLAEDLIGLIRDDGVALDREILALLMETGDTLRAMLEETAATRADVDPAGSEALMARLADKIERCRAGAEPAFVEAAVAEAPPAQDPVPPEPGRESEPAAPLPPPSRLADDPAYRAIFRELVAEKLARLRGIAAAGETGSALRPLDDLAHAAAQMGMADWIAALSDRPDPLEARALATLIAGLEALALAEAASPLPVPAPAGAPETPGAAFFDILAEPLRLLARMGVDFATGTAPVPADLARTVDLIATTGQASGYVRLADHAAPLLAATTATEFRRAELRLYEDLATIEALDPEHDPGAAVSPRRLLASWSADHIFDALEELDRTLELMRGGLTTEPMQEALERLVRLVHHACRHYGLDVAAQLAMSLLDLFGRGHALGQAPDAILMRIARGFVDTLELVFDALREGEAPDTARLEELFVEASEASFAGRGLLTATAVERQLGLPAEFHRVLSPESVRAASEAIAQGMAFHILRADVNDDDRLAEALFEFIGSGAIRAITNVTVFRGNETLFDFLIATALDESELSEALAGMDPGGHRLVLLRRLEAQDGAAPPQDGAEALQRAAGDLPGGVELSADVLERIGVIAAGQAMVHDMIAKLAEEDLPASLDEILRRGTVDTAQGLRDFAGALGQRLRDLAQIETQLLGQMTELQQGAAALRARPAETVLRPLAALAATQARKAGRELRITTGGAELTFDIALLDSLKRVLRPLVLSRIALPDAPGRMHLAVRRAEDHLALTLEDDGGATSPEEALDPALAELATARGRLRSVALPGGGLRFHVSLPISQVVMEGMVVGAGGARYVLPVEAIRTILQPETGALLQPPMRGGGEWLRLNADEVITLRRLPQVIEGPPSGAPPVIVVLGREGESVAVPVDEVVGQQLVLLRPLRGVLARLPGVTGVALLAGGEVGMVLSAGLLCGAGEASESLAGFTPMSA